MKYLARLRTLFWFSLGFALCVISQSAHAQSLAGRFYKTTAASINTVAEAESYISSNSATGNFRARLLNYNGTDNSTITQFLSTDSTTYTGTSANFRDGILDITGHITLTTATTAFRLTSDDGARLYINGQTVANNDGVHAVQTVTGNFTGTGTYDIRIVYFNKDYNGGNGQTQLRVEYDPAGGTNFQNVPTNALSTPELPTIVLMVTILLPGAFTASLRRKSRKTLLW